MNLIKRVFLYGLLNIFIIATLSIFWAILSSFFNLPTEGYLLTLIFCMVFGMGGSFISLFLSKYLAKKLMKVKTLPFQNKTEKESQLAQIVKDLSKKAKLKAIPEIGIYQSEDLNAFATGSSQNNALVAVSSGLLNTLSTEELEGVIAHEIAHIANGDMITMALLQGVINTLVMLLARIIAHAISLVDEDMGPFMYFGIIIVLQIALGVLGSILVNSFSRHREFKADYGSAKLSSKEKMIAALRALNNSKSIGQSSASQPAFNAFKISNKNSKNTLLTKLFSTHPSIEARIQKLEQL
ncbi:MAG: protease HtpX [Bdellovibrionaceae bacterium]|nr:protease HtpX [Pseudobdellovibrionaceae bacterium]